MIFNLGNVVGLIKSVTAPEKKYVIWAKILNPSLPDIVELNYFDPVSNNWIPLTNSTTNYFLRPVISRALTTPPSTNLEGDRYLIAPGASGAWLGKDNQVAEYRNGSWVFTVPQDGYLLLVRAENKILLDYQGTWGAGGTWEVSDFSIPINPNDFIPKTDRGKNGGVPELDNEGKIPITRIRADELGYEADIEGSYPNSVDTIWKALDYISTKFGLKDVTVENITQRDAIEDKIDGLGVLVRDASDDPEITIGWAFYKYDYENNSWFLIAKGETADIDVAKLLYSDTAENKLTYTPIDNDNISGYFAGLISGGKIILKNVLDKFFIDIRNLLQKSHSQNTDQGTSNEDFYIGDEDSKIRINKDTGDFEYTKDGENWETVEGGDQEFDGNRAITTVPVKGKIPGGNTIKEVLNNLLYGDVPPTVTANITNPNREFTIISTTTFQVNWTITKNTNPITSIIVGGQPITPTGESQSGTTNIVLPSNVNASITIKASDGKEESQISLPIKFQHRLYYGAIAKDGINQVITDSDILSLTGEPRDNRYITIPNIDANGKYILIAMPDDWGQPLIFINGLLNNAYTLVRNDNFINSQGYSKKYKILVSNTTQFGATNIEIK